MPMYEEMNRAAFATKTADKLIALVKQMSHAEGDKASKALAYYDGMQKAELIKVLDAHRQQWRQDSIIPRTRNLTKMIVEKSGQIVQHTPPQYEVFAASEDDVADEILTEQLEELMNKSDSIETWINLDEVVRLLKTALVLCGWDDDEDCIVYDILHRGNSLVKWHPVSKIPELLLYNVYSNNEYDAYRLYLVDQVLDFTVTSVGNSITVTGDEENPLGIIPVSQFYDTQAPRTGFWNVVPLDLIDMNEIYNMHITESEYAISWMKKPTLFTNAPLSETMNDGQSSYQDSVSTGTSIGKQSKFPNQRTALTREAVKFGPSTAIQLDTSGVDSAFAEFKAPDVDIRPIDDVINNWVASYASDWSVRVDTNAAGHASSGFQLIVEELPNLELRKQRQKMFAIGLSRLFDVIKVVANTYADFNFPEDSKLFVEFGQPNLPVDQKVQEEVWTMKINEGRASIIDYFKEVHGMSDEEAADKVVEIQQINELLNPKQPVPPQLAQDPNADPNAEPMEDDGVVEDDVEIG